MRSTFWLSSLKASLVTRLTLRMTLKMKRMVAVTKIVVRERILLRQMFVRPSLRLSCSKFSRFGFLFMRGI